MSGKKRKIFITYEACEAGEGGGECWGCRENYEV